MAENISFQADFFFRILESRFRNINQHYLPISRRLGSKPVRAVGVITVHVKHFKPKSQWRTKPRMARR